MTRRRGADRDDLRRRPASREPRSRILVVCEGEKTEPTYFRSLSRLARNPLVQIEIAKEHGVPRTLVDHAVEQLEASQRRAKSERDAHLAFDEVWAVFDVDEHPHIPEAAQLATARGVSLAISSPSFELWPLLHFQDQTRAEGRQKIRELLKKHLPKYHKVIDAADPESSGEPAVAHRRAASLAREAEREADPRRNPSTGVFALVEKIRNSAT